MSVKQFKLPKEFASKWLKALRSGTYTQKSGSLHCEGGYCCLGVAARLAGCDSNELYEKQLLIEGKFSSYPIPEELIGTTTANPTVRILSCLNDGVTESSPVIRAYYWRNSIFRHGDPEEHFARGLGGYKLDFSQIADFIEDNFELY